MTKCSSQGGSRMAVQVQQQEAMSEIQVFQTSHFIRSTKINDSPIDLAANGHLSDLPSVVILPIRHY